MWILREFTAQRQQGGHLVKPKWGHLKFYLRQIGAFEIVSHSATNQRMWRVQRYLQTMAEGIIPGLKDSDFFAAGQFTRTSAEDPEKQTCW